MASNFNDSINEAKKTYIRSAKRLYSKLKKTADGNVSEAMLNFLYGYHKMGIKYFDPGSIDGYIAGDFVESREIPRRNEPYTDEELDEQAQLRIVIDDTVEPDDLFDKILVVNKKGLFDDAEENGLEIDSNMNTPNLEIAIDDVYRHAVIYDMETNTVLEVPHDP